MEPAESETFETAARIAAALACGPEVAARWYDESACAGMTVGGLAHHLTGQLGNTVRLVGEEASSEPPIPLLAHYAEAAWVTASLDDEVNAEIRESSDAAAQSGPDALPPLVDDLLDRLAGVLAARRSDDPVFIPWQGWSLTAHDWLVTRMMEIVVHSDDLAASVGVRTPEFPIEVITPVLGLLTAVACRRHGQVPVVRALSRPQRAPASVSAF
jgi:hypothetical protein